VTIWGEGLQEWERNLSHSCKRNMAETRQRIHDGDSKTSNRVRTCITDSYRHYHGLRKYHSYLYLTPIKHLIKMFHFQTCYQWIKVFLVLFYINIDILGSDMEYLKVNPIRFNVQIFKIGTASATYLSVLPLVLWQSEVRENR
jgi:hypothetical protein